MERLRFLGIAALLLACGDGRVAPWLGEWDVLMDEAERPCIDPMATPTLASSASVWTIVDDGDGRLGIPGECRFVLQAETANTATLLDRACEVMSPTGRPLRVEPQSGMLRRDGDLFFGHLVIRLTYLDDGACYESNVDVDAVRL